MKSQIIYASKQIGLETGFGSRSDFYLSLLNRGQYYDESYLPRHHDCPDP